MRRILLLLCLGAAGCCCELESPVGTGKDDPKVIGIKLPAKEAPAAFSGWPMFGGTLCRNMANPVAKNIPAEFTPDSDKVRWSVELGTKVYAGPVISGGKLFVGTNNQNPRAKDKGNLAVLECFEAASGKPLWQITHGMPENEIFSDVTKVRMGLLSTPAVDGDMLFYSTVDAVVVGASTAGKVVWTYDMIKELKVHPYHCSCSCPLVVGDIVVLLTGNGIAEGGTVPEPKAPSFVALDKKTGKLVWKSALPGDKIIEGQWSNPSVATVNGKKQVIFPGGDGVIYALKPEDGSVIWKFNCYPKGIPREEGEPTPPYFVGTPVCLDGKVFIGMGTMPEHPTAPRFSYFLCIDATKSGDISAKTLTPGDPDNKGSGLVWSYGGAILPRPPKGRPVNFGPTISTPAIHGELVFITEEAGYLHCLDVKTGKRNWVHDFKSSIWGSAYYADGKVFVGVEDGVMHTVAADAKLKVLFENDMGDRIHGTAVVADDTLYVVAGPKLYAIGGKK